MNAAFKGLWHRVLRRIGPLGAVALVLLLGAALLVVWLPRLAQETATLQAEHAARSALLQRSVPVAAAPRVSVGQQIGEFVRVFPPLSQSTDDLQQVFDSAHRRNLRLPKGEYQFRKEGNSPLVTVTASFPVVADYPALRDFSADVLKALPNASLDELRMTRDAAGSPALESWVRFSFVYRRS